MIRCWIAKILGNDWEREKRERLHGELAALKFKSDEIAQVARKEREAFRSKWGRERELTRFISLPGPECSSPRDGLQLLKSKDTLFLSLLLHRSEGTKHIIEALDPSGAWSYFPEVEGTAASVTSRGMTIKSRLNRSTLRGYFKETYLLFRSGISSREAAHHDFFIGEKLVRAFDSAGSKALWKLGANLQRPFTDQGDSLADRLHELSFFDWLPEGSTKAPTLKHGEVYCPLDGPVTPIKAAEKTPALSWELLCGREWGLYLCPKCLGSFDRWMWKIN